MLRVLVCCALLAVPFGGAVAGSLADAVAAFDAGRYRQALVVLEPLAEQGAASAQLRLGKAYASGRGVTMDGSQAARWFEAAAKQGNAEAQYALGRLYLSGWGVETNPKQGVAWLWKSGRQGHLKAQLLLGRLLASGDRVPQDIEAARLWYAEAATQGSPKARRALAKLGGAPILPGQSAAVAEVAEVDETAVSVSGDDPADTVRRRLSEVRSVRPSAGAAAIGVATDGTTTVAEPEPEPEPEPEQPPAAVDVAADEQSEFVLEGAGEELVADDDGVLMLEQDAMAEASAPATMESDSVVEAIAEPVVEETAGDIAMAETDPAPEAEAVSRPESSTADVVAEPLLTAQEAAPETRAAVAIADVAAADEAQDVPVSTDAPVADDPAAGQAPTDAMVDAEPAAEPAGSADDVAAIDPEPAPIHGADWVLERPSGHYTIQLMGSWSEPDVMAFIDEHALRGEVIAVVESRRRGKRWFSLLYGDYSSYGAALKVHGAFEPAVAKHGPWIRPYRKIHGGVVRP